jgi:hypothetical protein
MLIDLYLVEYQNLKEDINKAYLSKPCSLKKSFKTAIIKIGENESIQFNQRRHTKSIFHSNGVSIHSLAGGLSSGVYQIFPPI